MTYEELSMASTTIDRPTVSATVPIITVNALDTGELLLYGIRGNFHQEKIFANFTICSYWRNFYRTNFFAPC